MIQSYTNIIGDKPAPNYTTPIIEKQENYKKSRVGSIVIPLAVYIGMKPPSRYSYKEKITVAESLDFHGLEKTIATYQLSEKIIRKWHGQLADLRLKKEAEDIAAKEYAKKQYANLSAEQKAIKNKPKDYSVYKRYAQKHIFKTLIKSLRKNLKQKKHHHTISFSEIDLWKMAKKQKCLCAISGLKLTADNISIDHIIPLSKGGSSDISNIQLVNKQVNIMKLNMNLAELLFVCKAIIQTHNQLT